ncbi:hypothetical protein [Actinomadura sp. 6K520]|jgi:DNA-binding IclR family transcriptional regulator|uniref:hypothetical protein n=1 Tax=Actinomadura sp. 6K520 TaxID=2530364 RepID=UPI001053E959|nr:hypothetical protein [Actinomadura sp. 6K520]TDE17050.1 hypothetical protein E1289_35990 [Actinomadura sp. 6K520]
MIGKLHSMGVKSSHMYSAGIASVGLALASWAASNRLEDAGLERADRWGIFIGEWAPTFFAMGVALRLEESHDQAAMEAPGQRERAEERVGAAQSTMR